MLPHGHQHGLRFFRFVDGDNHRPSPRHTDGFQHAGARRIAIEHWLLLTATLRHITRIRIERDERNFLRRQELRDQLPHTAIACQHYMARHIRRFLHQ